MECEMNAHAQIVNLLKIAMAEKGITQAQLARRMKTFQQSVSRIMDPEHHSTMSQYKLAFAALGLQLKLEVHPMYTYEERPRELVA